MNGAIVMHRLVSFSGFDIFNQYEVSFCKLIDEKDTKYKDCEWNKLMASRGFSINDEKTDVLPQLFHLICAEFSERFQEKRSINLKEGFISSHHGQIPVKHNKMARVFSQSKSVYIDLLMSNVLFDYVAAFYLWARFPDKQDIVSECFIHTLYTLEGCCRKGQLSEIDGQLSLQKLISENLEDHEIVFIGDLYWCMLAFALCHETAHIYLDHGETKCEQDGHLQEYQADAVGYEVFLDLVLKYMNSTEDDITSVFREYLYAAPMILFLFYHDLFSIGYWMYGDVVSNSHPDLEERITRLLAISQQNKFPFDTTEGNAVLSHFYEVSDRFLEEVWYKLKNGKLCVIIRKGISEVKDQAFEEAYALDESICKRIIEYAKKLDCDAGRLIGLWNVAAQISIESVGDSKGIVCSLADRQFSIKGMNIIYNQKVLLESIIEMGLTIAVPTKPIETIRTALYIIYRIALASTIEINDVLAKLLKVCHQQNAYFTPIAETKLLCMVPLACSEDITVLHNMGCIKIVDGNITLNERIILR